MITVQKKGKTLKTVSLCDRNTGDFLSTYLKTYPLGNPKTQSLSVFLHTLTTKFLQVNANFKNNNKA